MIRTWRPRGLSTENLAPFQTDKKRAFIETRFGKDSSTFYEQCSTPPGFVVENIIHVGNFTRCISRTWPAQVLREAVFALVTRSQFLDVGVKI